MYRAFRSFLPLTGVIAGGLFCGLGCDSILGLKRAHLHETETGGGGTGGTSTTTTSSTTDSTTTTTTTTGSGGGAPQPVVLAHFANVSVEGVAADPLTGAIYLAGAFPNAASFGQISFNTAGGKDMFLTKLEATGSVTWAKQIGGSSDDEGQNVAFANHSVTVVGQAPSGVTVEGQPIPSVVPPSLPTYFAARYGEDGSFQWLSACVGRGFADVAIDPSNGDAVLAGSFFTHQCGVQSYFPSGDRDIFITRLAASTGAEVKTNTYHGGQFNYANALVVDSFKNIFFAGWVDTSVTIGPYLLPDRAMYAAELDKAGTVPWAKQIGTGRFSAVAADAQGNIVAYGQCTDPAKPFGAAAAPAAGDGPVCVAKISGISGAIIWARRFGSAGVEAGPNKAGTWAYPTRTLAVSSTGDVAIVGFTNGPLSLDAFPVTQAGFVAVLDGMTGGVRYVDSLGFVTAGVAFSKQDDLVVAGTFGPGAITIGGETLTTAGGEVDTFVALITP